MPAVLPSAPSSSRPYGATRTPAALLLGLLALLGACASSDAEAPATTSADAEQSVAPGANERFLDPELDLEQCLETFEGESREVAVARAAITAQLELQAGEDVADIGAGTGLYMLPLAQAVGSEGKVYAVDISPRFIEHLEQRAQDAGLSQVSVVECSERSAELPEDSVDAVFICDTYHHFEYPQSTLASLRKALRPGGRLVVVDFERIPGVSRDWILGHVRIGREDTIAEIEAAGFEFVDQPAIDGLEENYLIRFTSP